MIIKLHGIKNTGNINSWPEQILSSTSASAHDVDAADLDGDGDIDVVSAAIYAHEIAYYINQGNDQFGNKQVIPNTTGSSEWVHTADIDQDGDSDILYLGNNSSVYVCKNNGNAIFSNPELIASSGVLKSLNTYDLDGDNDLDIPTTSPTSNRPNFHVNNGSGIFNETKFIGPNNDIVNQIIAFDVDNDNDMDVFTLSQFGSAARYFINNGDGTFRHKLKVCETSNETKSLISADLDGDGLLDLITTSSNMFFSNQDKISWFRNEGALDIENYVNEYSCHPSDTGTNFYVVDIPGGCETIYEVTTHLLESYLVEVQSEICSGTAYIINGQSFNTSGVFTINLTATNGCDSIILLTLDVITNTGPPVDFSIPTSIFCMADQSIDLFFFASPPGGIFTGSGISGTQFFVEAAGIGSHPLVYTYTYDGICVEYDTAWIFVVTCTGLNENAFLETISSYPNPFNQNITINYSLVNNSPVQIELIDINGRVIEIIEDKYQLAGMHDFILNAQDLANGMYYIKFQTEHLVLTRKIEKIGRNY
jgi:hypothetical protein